MRYPAVVKKLAPVIAVLVLVGSVLWYRGALTPLTPRSPDRVTLRIPKGASLRDIADLLEERGVIRSSHAFSLYSRLHGLSRSLQAGSYILRPSLSIPEVAEALRRGIAEEGVITMPEGFTVLDVGRLLTEKQIVEEGALIACAQTCDFPAFAFLPKEATLLAARGGRLEGYLFPDTYFVVIENFSPQAFLERLLREFEERVVKQYERELKKSKRTLHQIVTMASLVEEETRPGDERPVVAGILWKRFDAGMGLGVDATVRYVLKKPMGKLTVADLNANSPYNLRKFRGLPPGPIASPGIESIRATLFPKETPYWYYLHGADGRVHYAETNEEHNVNKYKYLSGGGEEG